MAQHQIVISSEWGNVKAKLVDNEATRSLVRILPVTIEMRDHLRQEKTGDLPSPLAPAPRQTAFSSLPELEAAIKVARDATRTSVIVIDTDPLAFTDAGGHWWDVVVPEVSERAEVRAARAAYETALKAQRLGD